MAMLCVSGHTYMEHGHACEGTHVYMAMLVRAHVCPAEMLCVKAHMCVPWLYL